MRLFQSANYEFIEKRRAAYVISSVVILIGIGAMIFNITSLGRWQNYGVDFTGGVLVEVRFDTDVTDEELRAALGGAQAPAITNFGEENNFVIRAGLDDEQSIQDIAADLEAQLGSAYDPATFEITRTDAVGPKIGSELETRAALAIIISFALTLLYLWVRFEVRFGMAAVVATLHDILITLGFLAIFRIEISLPTVAAILTIVGYSLNDTIVVFDRIRENLHKKGARKEDPVKLVDRSINETLPRTVLTSGTTLAVLLSLAILGGAVIRDFTIVLILGVVIGTYSSIFVASPALIEIQQRWKEDPEKARAREKRKRATAGV